MDIANIVDIIKVIVALVGAAVVFVAFLLPFFKTFIPLWRGKGVRPHFELWNRLILRLVIVILLLHEAIFPLDRLAGSNFNLVIMRATIIPVMLLIVLMLVHSWFRHPDGMRGL